MKITKKRKLYENRRNRADDEGVDARRFPIGTGGKSIGGMYNRRLGRGGSSSAGKSPYEKLVAVVDPYFSRYTKYTARGRVAGHSGTIAQTATFMGSPYPNSEKWYEDFYQAVGKVSKGKETMETLIDILDSEETKKIFNFKSDYMRKGFAEEKAQKISDALENLKSDLQNFANEKTPTNEGKTKMKITKRTLQRLIKEEIRKVLWEGRGVAAYILEGPGGITGVYSSRKIAVAAIDHIVKLMSRAEGAFPEDYNIKEVPAEGIVPGGAVYVSYGEFGSYQGVFGDKEQAVAAAGGGFDTYGREYEVEQYEVDALLGDSYEAWSSMNLRAGLQESRRRRRRTLLEKEDDKTLKDWAAFCKSGKYHSGSPIKKSDDDKTKRSKINKCLMVGDQTKGLGSHMRGGGAKVDKILKIINDGE